MCKIQCSGVAIAASVLKIAHLIMESSAPGWAIALPVAQAVDARSGDVSGTAAGSLADDLSGPLEHRWRRPPPAAGRVAPPRGPPRPARPDRQRCAGPGRTHRRAGPDPSPGARSGRVRAARKDHRSAARRRRPEVRRRRSIPHTHTSASRPPVGGSRCANNAVGTSPPHGISARVKPVDATRRKRSDATTDDSLDR